MYLFNLKFKFCFCSACTKIKTSNIKKHIVDLRTNDHFYYFHEQILWKSKAFENVELSSLKLRAKTFA